MEYFQFGIQVFFTVVGFVVPIIGLILSVAVMRWTVEQIAHQKYMREYKSYMEPEYWFFRGAEDVPNPMMVRLKFENSRSREILNLSVERKDLPQ